MSRESTIEFEMNYCQHYRRGKGADMVCKAGMNLKEVMQVPVGPDAIKWGPCIKGHTLDNPTQYCPHWIRRTREMGEKLADSVEKSTKLMTEVMPVVNEWRNKKPIGKQEIIKCPACHGNLHLSQAAYNGQVHARCETADCVSWIE